MHVYTAFLGALQFAEGRSYGFARKQIILPNSTMENKHVRIYRASVTLNSFVAITPAPYFEYCLRAGGYAEDGFQNLISTLAGDRWTDSMLAYRHVGALLTGAVNHDFDFGYKGIVIPSTSAGLYFNAQITSNGNEVISHLSSSYNAVVQLYYEREVF